MKRHYCVVLLAALLPLTAAVASAADKQMMSKIKSAMSAAPSSIANEATIMDWPATPDAKPALLRQGTNGWTCFPDFPVSPGPDPMCLDKQWMAWMDGYLKHTAPVITGVGIGYMLAGGSSASNEDPFAEMPKAGEHWMKEPPHIMVISPGKLDPAMFSQDPHSGGHWIMFGGTPYEHLMIPVK